MSLSALSDNLVLFENRGRLLESLDSLLRTANVPADVIGGVALGFYNYVRNTEDIDILIQKSDYDTVANALVAKDAVWLGKEKFSWLSYTIQICCGGQKIRDTEFPEPANTIPGLKPVSLSRLLAMKVEGGLNQFRHRADFIELVKRNKVGSESFESEVLSLLSPKARRTAIALWNKAQKEMG